MRWKSATIISALVIICVVGGYLFTDWYKTIPDSATAQFVGRQACIQCHQAQAELFHGSHHDNAMDIATEKTVLGAFDGRTITTFGIESRFFKADGKFFVNTEGPDGKLADFEVKYVFGIEPLQQYMVEFDRPADMPSNEISRLQVLSLCWDTEKKLWFQLQPPDVKEKIEPGDPLHWTGQTQCWNTSCADCHSTDLKKNFDLDKLTYHTTFSEIDVSCEACHGPGSQHVEMANSKSLFWDRKKGYGLAKLKGDDTTAQIETCAKCHSRRGSIQEGFCGGKNFHDHYNSELLTEQTYHADGQIKDEVYVYGSFLQSKMYHEGIRCTDCHDPHSTKVKFDTNELCTSCHAHPAGKYDTPSHHRHKEGSTGAQCVECHMPETTYMHVDPRRDHSLRIPRPDLSVKHKTPNACSQCHIDAEKLPAPEKTLLTGKQYLDWLTLAKENKTVADELSRLDEWATKNIEQWYDQPKRPDHYAETFARIRSDENDSDAYKKLRRMISDTNVADFVRATAATELARSSNEIERNASRAFLGSDKDNMSPALTQLFVEKNVHVLQGLLQTAEVEISTIINSPWKAQSSAVFLEALRNYIVILHQLAENENRVVRIEAARVSLRIPSTFHSSIVSSKQAAIMKTAFDELIESVKSNQERGSALLALGSIYQLKAEVDNSQRDQVDVRLVKESDRYFEMARKAYQDAIRVAPNDSGARGNLAALNDQLIERLQLKINAMKSSNPQEQKKLEDQIAELRNACIVLRKGELEVLRVEAQRAIQSQVGASVIDRFAMALYVDKQVEESEKQLKIAVDLAPDDPTILLHYVLVLEKRLKFKDALNAATKLLALVPNDPTYVAIRNRLAAAANK